MAAPFVTGTIGLLHTLHPDWSYSQLIRQVLSSVDKVSSLSGKVATGGRLNAGKAVGADQGDTSGARVVSMTPNASGLDPVTSVRLTFSEAIDPATFTAGDIVSFTGPNGAISVTGIKAVAGSGDTQFDLTFASQTTPGTYKLVLGPDIRDKHGNQMDQDRDGVRGEATQDRFSGSFTINGVSKFETGGIRVEDPTTTVVPLIVDQDIRVADLTVRLTLTHPSMGELTIKLRGPDGTEVTLFNRRGGTGDNLKVTTFDDAATRSIAEGAGPVHGDVPPRAVAVGVRRQAARGTWQLVITDQVAGNRGRLNIFTLFIAGAPGGGSSSVAESAEAPASAAQSQSPLIPSTDPILVSSVLSTPAAAQAVSFATSEQFHQIPEVAAPPAVAVAVRLRDLALSRFGAVPDEALSGHPRRRAARGRADVVLQAPDSLTLLVPGLCPGTRCLRGSASRAAGHPARSAGARRSLAGSACRGRAPARGAVSRSRALPGNALSSRLRLARRAHPEEVRWRKAEPCGQRVPGQSPGTRYRGKCSRSHRAIRVAAHITSGESFHPTRIAPATLTSMAQDITPPDPAVVLDLLDAFRRSKAMFAAVSLGVFDALAGRARSRSPTLAADLEADPDALDRLLDACVGLRLLGRTAAGYANTPAAAGLPDAAAARTALTGYLNYSNDVLWKLWANLEDAVREGTHRWKQTFGWDGPIFANFFHDEEAKREFLMGMHGFGLISSPQVVAAFDLCRFRRLVDLGGATGPPGRRRLPALPEPAGGRVRPAGGGAAGPRRSSAASPVADRDRRSWRATSSPIRCRRPTCTPWAASCTTGPRRRSCTLLAAIHERLPRGRGGADRREAARRTTRPAPAGRRCRT